MNEKDPAIQKQLGKEIYIIKGEWDRSKDVIMKNLMTAKFKEHHDLAIQLINTKEKLLLKLIIMTCIGHQVNQLGNIILFKANGRGLISLV